MATSKSGRFGKAALVALRTFVKRLKPNSTRSVAMGSDPSQATPDPAIARSAEEATVHFPEAPGMISFLISIGVDFTGQDYANPQELWTAIYDGGYTEFLEYLRSDASLNNVHPDAELTLPKLYATEGFVGTQAARRQSEPVRQVTYVRDALAPHRWSQRCVRTRQFRFVLVLRWAPVA